MGSSNRARLKVLRGETKDKLIWLEPGENLIGRWDPDSGAFPEVDLEAEDVEAKISRKHAVIYFENGVATIEDMGSLNGTFVNRGERLEPGSSHVLKDGDEVVIGKTFLKFEMDSD